MANKENPRYDGHCKALTNEECQARMDAGEKPVLRFDVPTGETRTWRSRTCCAAKST